MSDLSISINAYAHEQRPNALLQLFEAEALLMLYEEYWFPIISYSAVAPYSHAIEDLFHCS